MHFNAFHDHDKNIQCFEERKWLHSRTSKTNGIVDFHLFYANSEIWKKVVSNGYKCGYAQFGTSS